MAVRVDYLPVVTTLWFTATFIISYTISVFNGHVYYFLPYISDTAALPPESCYFGQMLNVGALLLFICMIVRYKQVKLIGDALHLNDVDKWNTKSRWFACCACLGLDIVANFQETTVLVMHCIGAFVCFAMGTVYFIIQTKISYILIKGMKGSPHRIRKSTFYIRLCLALLFVPVFLIANVASAISISEFDGEHIYYWTPENKGYYVHLLATFTEWLVALFMLIYVATFTKEFKAMTFNKIDFSVDVV